MYVYYHRYAESVGAIHFHTSAKTNKGLDEVFESLAQSNTIFASL